MKFYLMFEKCTGEISYSSAEIWNSGKNSQNVLYEG